MPGQIDEASRAALGRLTENEKACLRRRLLHQTAKEMAIDLGISPHAVEKRLKMARTKLGLSSSLQAARLLAAAEEGYDRPVPETPDLAPAPDPDQTDPHAEPGHRRRIALFLISGVALMSLILAALFALSPAQQDSVAPDPAPGMRRTTMQEAGIFLAEIFRSLDRDGSGFLDRDEVSRLEPRDRNRDPQLPPAPAAGQPDPAAEAKWMRKLDTDRDDRVSRDEYIVYMTPWIMLSGVPVDWKPGG